MGEAAVAGLIGLTLPSFRKVIQCDSVLLGWVMTSIYYLWLVNWLIVKICWGFLVGWLLCAAKSQPHGWGVSINIVKGRKLCGVDYFSLTSLLLGAPFHSSLLLDFCPSFLVLKSASILCPVLNILRSRWTFLDLFLRGFFSPLPWNIVCALQFLGFQADVWCHFSQIEFHTLTVYIMGEAFQCKAHLFCVSSTTKKRVWSLH